MADLSVNVAGISSPNPFWLASGPLTNTAYQVMKAFDEGWGGAVWKTVGEPVINVSSRLASIDYGNRRMMGLNNVELISDRPIEDNLREIAEVKRRFPKHAVVVSLMLPSVPEVWKDMMHRVEDTGADGVELNFGCPHGMNERGMGSVIGQVPEYTEQITAYAKADSHLPVIVKLTPNVTDIRNPGRAAVQGGADALSLINTINSVMGVDLDTWLPRPQIDGRGSHGGYCGPAVKPIGLYMVSALANDLKVKVPLVGIGGIESWQDAVEYLLLGAQAVQVCTAAMHYGFRIIHSMIEGLNDYLNDRGIVRVQDIVGRSANKVGDWNDLRLSYSYKVVAKIHEDKCIGCNLCYVACDDGGHQCIDKGQEMKAPVVREEDCVGCNLCALVCPVPGCIEMQEHDLGIVETWRQRQDRLTSLS
ncbi:NAD-dependent dihydropyrimidine dehydrogenase subunit PreA [Sulfobacillus thermosulfidooxidans]|uniref:NAD-dependent dihydropyrimidine dehydrogenase subunit PreA n=1 Tax=Sulfobacillus thermosulfidooxidans TaxID=28034 RepID=UPI00096B76BD|nr:NAD-dependent dihydropyrimidine dehydrogenase subunit PreA [Sulfobacillus thermosulfidooxidans]OLZ11211.1 dihydropyrimidine dehydrogenase subunit B [Sulfobacillus thermosulfidooxidans]OLZ13450.1 dihydropyrimidine dehydrogenase subunit B [Sulfobacillus thermosulfidooxidans]OLZ21697.1 dihydropyrimidine dehydrogenase subunit B [Sulfobacillus thermosulfidooxidans]